MVSFKYVHIFDIFLQEGEFNFPPFEGEPDPVTRF